MILSPLSFFLMSAGLITALVAASRPLFGLILLVMAAVAVDYATHDLLLMAVVSTAITGCLCLAVLREKQLKMPGTPVRIRTPADGTFLWLFVISVAYMIVGLVRGNNVVLVAGDFFHLVFEMCAPFFLCMVFLRSSRRLEGFSRQLALWMLIFSGLILALYVTGIFQKLPGAGYWYRAFGILRIRYNHHYPLVPLIWLIAIWLYQTRADGRLRTGLSAAATFVVLILGLKRALWIALVMSLVFFLSQIGARYRAQAIRGVFGGIVVILVVAWIFLPGRFLETATELETYGEAVGERFSTHESDINFSVKNRRGELDQAVSTAVRNPLGYGLGSEFEFVGTFTGTLIPTHYVHNAYIHYSLQIGFWWLLFLLVLSVKVFRTGFRLFKQLPDGIIKGAVLGAIAGYASILFVALTEIAVNTFFLPITAGFIFAADHVAREEGLIRVERRRGEAIAATGTPGGLEA